MTHDEIEWHARHFDHLAALYAAEKGTDDATRWSQAAALIRRLRDERDEALRNGTDKATAWDAVAKARVEARNKALDDAYMAWKDNYADAGLAILALKTQEPKP